MFPKLLQPPSDSAFHDYNAAEGDCLLQTEAHSALLGHWGLTAAGLPSSDIASPSGLALHSGNMPCFQLELVLPDCSAGLLGQEGEVPGCSASDTDYLPAGCADDTAAAAAGTVSETAADADADSDSDIPVGDQVCLAEMNCLRNVDG